MKRLLKTWMFAGVLFIGCAKHPMNPQISMTPPKYVEQMPSREEENINNPGSLFTNGDNLFSDTKARKINDIVTVIITEEISQSSQASKKLSETNADNGGLVDATISGGAYIGGKEYKMAKTGIGINFPAMNSNRSYQGSGTQQRKEQFKTTVSARIVKILENGNYFIYGKRTLFFDGQKQIVQVSGVIRPEDISADNTIDSKYISDAKIAYKSEGDIKTYTDQNWLSKFWSAIAPW
ncbi:MAG: flagellar basal body L-ring protein FlgH [Epsilonproteobacteria bacterium]|nr:flagellar basal body L-ring protein FlgH [Campylobacterota bacterium]